MPELEWKDVDLRRTAARDMVECLARRSRALEPGERALVQAHYIEGIPAERLAPLIGCSPEVARRRIRAVTARVSSDKFAFVLANRERWSPVRRRVATVCFVHGRTMRSAARRLGMSLHTVRRHCEAVIAQWAGVRGREK